MSNFDEMGNAINLFDRFINSEQFSTCPGIIFFNKADIFKQKVEKLELETSFQDYVHGSDFQKALEFIQQKYLSKIEFNRERFTIMSGSAFEIENVIDLISIAKKEIFQIEQTTKEKE